MDFSGMSKSRTVSETEARSLELLAVRDTTLVPMRLAMLAVWTTEDVFPVLERRIRRSFDVSMGVVISPTKCTSNPSWTRRTAKSCPISPDLPDP